MYELSDKISMVEEPVAMLSLSRKGVSFDVFQSLADRLNYTIKQWSKYLHITERTIQRYKKENKPFEPMQSERIIKIGVLHSRGAAIFGSEESFESWMRSQSVALGSIQPIELLDSGFGIEMLMDELGRIEHGVLA